MSGFLTESVAWVRKFVDEPTINKKYSDTEIIRMIEAEWTSVLGEINFNAIAPIVVRHDIVLASGTNVYILPPTIGIILRFSKIGSNGMPEWRVVPEGRYNPCGPGVLFEGNSVRFQPNYIGAGETLTLEYIPTGDVRLHEGVAGTVTANTVALASGVSPAAAPTLGQFDNRPNAYAGSVLRILTASTNNYVQERIIKSFDVTTGVATVEPAFNPVPSGATVTYEIAPLLYKAQGMVVPIAAARIILATEEKPVKFKLLTQLYGEKIRRARLDAANVETISGTRFVMDSDSRQRTMAW